MSKVFTGSIEHLEVSNTMGAPKLEKQLQEFMDFVHTYANRNGMENLEISITTGLMKATNARITFNIDDGEES